MSIAAALSGAFATLGDPARQVALRVPVTPGEYNVATGVAEHRDERDVTIPAGLVTVAGYSAYQITASGGRILAADRRVRIHAHALPRVGPHAGLQPTPAHRLVLDGVVHQIIAVETKRVGPEVGSYVLQIRGPGVVPGYPAQTSGTP